MRGENRRARPPFHVRNRPFTTREGRFGAHAMPPSAAETDASSPQNFPPGAPFSPRAQVCIAALTTIQEKVKGVKDIVKIEETIAAYCEKPANEKEIKLVRLSRCRRGGRVAPLPPRSATAANQHLPPLVPAAPPRPTSSTSSFPHPL